MALRLTYRGNTSVPVELEGFIPDWTRDKSIAEIERFEIFVGNQKIPLAEMFSVSGDPADQRFDFEGDLTGVHWIGAHMRTGQIHIHGPAGRHLGSEMHGGEIRVEGNAGSWVGAEMHGGQIHVQGNAEQLVGAAYRGSRTGMTGGVILIDGNVGHEVGQAMRRGLIAVAGRAGDMLGFNMIAGTIVVFGECGIRPGAGMRRGTICLLGPQPPRLLPTFRYGSKFQPLMLKLLLHDLRNKGFHFDPSVVAHDMNLYNGDLVSLGKGEILVRCHS